MINPITVVDNKIDIFNKEKLIPTANASMLVAIALSGVIASINLLGSMDGLTNACICHPQTDS